MSLFMREWPSEVMERSSREVSLVAAGLEWRAEEIEKVQDEGTSARTRPSSSRPRRGRVRFRGIHPPRRRR